jgi:hypothetical protein
VTGAYYDTNNEAGTSGQILSTTATGTDWIAAPTVYTFSNGITNTSGAVKLGGSLTQNTTLTGTSYDFEINNNTGSLALANIWNENGYTQQYTNGATGQYTYKSEGTSTLFWDAYYPSNNRSNITVAQNNIGLYSDNLTNAEASAVNTAPASVQLTTTNGTTTSSIITSPTNVTISGPERVQISGTVRLSSVSTKTANFNVAVGDRLYVCNSSSPFTATLPGSPSTGDEYVFKNINTGTVTVSGNGKNINGAASTTLPTQWDSLHIVYTGSIWVTY